MKGEPPPMDDLFDPKRVAPHVVGALPDTSTAANKAKRTSEQQALVLDILEAANYLTCYEIADRSKGKLNHVQVDRLRAPMVRANLVEDSGLRRPGPNGRDCIIWRKL